MKNNILIAIFISLFSNMCFADWMSDVDKKYKNKSPDAYSKVAKAQGLISAANGNGDMNREAYDLLGSVLDKNPKFAPAYVQLARLASNVGILPDNKFDGSSLQSQEQLLNKALKLEPDYDYAIALMGYTKMFQGDLGAAGQYYERAVKMGTGYPFLKTQLAQLELKRGNYVKALDMAKQAYEQNKAEPVLAAAAITEMLFAFQKLPGDTVQEEEKWFAKRRELVPSAWNWQAHASFRLYRLGDYEKAIEYANKALSIMNFGAAQYTLAAAYYKKWNDLKGDSTRSKEATEAWKIAFSIHPDTSDMIPSFLNSTALRSTGEALSIAQKSPR